MILTSITWNLLCGAKPWFVSSLKHFVLTQIDTEYGVPTQESTAYHSHSTRAHRFYADYQQLAMSQQELWNGFSQWIFAAPTTNLTFPFLWRLNHTSPTTRHTSPALVVMIDAVASGMTSYTSFEELEETVPLSQLRPLVAFGRCAAYLPHDVRGAEVWDVARVGVIVHVVEIVV
jgi:hypothetical protein